MTEQAPALIKVQAYSLAEALQQAQDGIIMGYTIDLESNEGYPQQFGSMITFTLVKTTEEPFPGLGEVVQEDKPVQGYALGKGENVYVAKLEVLKEQVGTNRKYTKKEK